MPDKTSPEIALATARTRFAGVTEKLELAQSRAEADRDAADAAKAEAKEARKRYKQARKTAKASKKEVKSLERELKEVELEVAMIVAKLKKRGAKPASGRRPQKSPKKKTAPSIASVDGSPPALSLDGSLDKAPEASGRIATSTVE